MGKSSGVKNSSRAQEGTKNESGQAGEAWASNAGVCEVKMARGGRMGPKVPSNAIPNGDEDMGGVVREGTGWGDGKKFRSGVVTSSRDRGGLGEETWQGVEAKTAGTVVRRTAGEGGSEVGPSFTSPAAFPKGGEGIEKDVPGGTGSSKGR